MSKMNLYDENNAHLCTWPCHGNLPSLLIWKGGSVGGDDDPRYFVPNPASLAKAYAGEAKGAEDIVCDYHELRGVMEIGRL